MTRKDSRRYSVAWAHYSTCVACEKSVNNHSGKTAVTAEKPNTGAILEAEAHLPEHVVYRSFVNETVVLNLRTGKYHGLNTTAGRMLDVLERSESVRAAAAVIAEEYGRPLDEIEHDLSNLCVELLERGLIEMSGHKER